MESEYRIRVRPLDWIADYGPSKRGKTVKSWVAPSLGGWHYEVKRGKLFRLFLAGTELGRFTDEDEAKEAAYRHHASAVISRIESVYEIPLEP